MRGVVFLIFRVTVAAPRKVAEKVTPAVVFDGIGRGGGEV